MIMRLSHPSIHKAQTFTPTQETSNTLVIEHDTQGLSKELKPKKIKGFCKNISFLMLSGNVLKNNKALFH
ncbi:hypothetical protein HYC85_028916 [Camellia sinensis]|uniref:Uncharacterized protein n=1 Tax=Camellia sinensis TaxID=4442 RepID=A0A7J7FWL8_CAMSI|nr:hypothetical protein HYC85_028916 [Camellia sinensis]